MFHEYFHILHSPKLTVRSCQEAILKGNSSKPTTVFQVRAVCFREGSHINWCPSDFWSINCFTFFSAWPPMESFWGPANFLAMPTRNTCSMVTLPPSVIPGDWTVRKKHTKGLHKTPTTKSDTKNWRCFHFPHIFLWWRKTKKTTWMFFAFFSFVGILFCATRKAWFLFVDLFL